MGINGFHKWIRATYPDSYVRFGIVQVDHLYIDVSSLFHTVVRASRNKRDFYVKLNFKLQQILGFCRPKRSVVFGMDGPAPLAKLVTQRRRRLKEAQRTGRSSRSSSGLSKQALTAGTPFMLELERALEFFVCQRLSSSRWRSLEFEILGSTVEGEGELKIMDRIMARRDCVAPTDSHVIVGGDSDLMLMALLSEIPNVYVINDNSDEFAELWSASEAKADKLREEMEAFGVNELRAAWQLAPETRSFAKTSEDLTQLVLDFATVVIAANGNDYLPAIRGLGAARPNRLGPWGVYLGLRRRRWEGLVLAAPEPRAPSEMWLDWREGLRVDRRMLLAILRPCNVLPRSPPSAGTADDPKEIVDSYMKGLAWNLDMYLRARCADYRFMYRRRLQQLRGTPALVAPASLPPDVRPGRPLLPNAFALALMPRSGSQFLIPALQPLLHEGSPIGDLYRECRTCLQLSLETGEATRKLQKLITRTKDLEEQSSETGVDVLEELQEVEQESEEVRSILRELSYRREEHQENDHVAKPFPVFRVEQAVRSVPLSRYSKPETILAALGRPYRYWRTYSNGREAHKTTKWELPAPPVDKWSPLKPSLRIARDVVQTVKSEDDEGRVSSNGTGGDDLKRPTFGRTVRKHSTNKRGRGARRLYLNVRPPSSNLQRSIACSSSGVTQLPDRLHSSVWQRVRCNAVRAQVFFVY
uniref:5'-3' exoribonuclease 1 n=1 Tax=Tetraselmis sp. GSL018 TaxID=582737 RepID=A0A061RAX5_9CHLO